MRLLPVEMRPFFHWESVADIIYAFMSNKKGQFSLLSLSKTRCFESKKSTFHKALTMRFVQKREITPRCSSFSSRVYRFFLPGERILTPSKKINFTLRKKILSSTTLLISSIAIRCFAIFERHEQSLSYPSRRQRRIQPTNHLKFVHLHNKEFLCCTPFS